MRTALACRTAGSRPLRAGPRPIGPGRMPGGMRFPVLRNTVGRACRSCSIPAASKCGTRLRSPSASCPLLTMGGIEALAAHGSDDLKARYLEKLVSGEWTATMNLTEPQAGSDLAALRSRAEPAGDGTYRITGPEDLHHLWRARSDRQHRPLRAGAPARRAARYARHLAVPRPQDPARRNAQRRALQRQSSTSSASMRRRPAR